jgi:hypothetical protein
LPFPSFVVHVTFHNSQFAILWCAAGSNPFDADPQHRSVIFRGFHQRFPIFRGTLPGSTILRTGSRGRSSPPFWISSRPVSRRSRRVLLRNPKSRSLSHRPHSQKQSSYCPRSFCLSRLSCDSCFSWFSSLFNFSLFTICCGSPPVPTLPTPLRNAQVPISAGFSNDLRFFARRLKPARCYQPGGSPSPFRTPQILFPGPLR